MLNCTYLITLRIIEADLFLISRKFSRRCKVGLRMCDF